MSLSVCNPSTTVIYLPTFPNSDAGDFFPSPTTAWKRPGTELKRDWGEYERSWKSPAAWLLHMFQQCIPLKMHCFQLFTAVDATFFFYFINRCCLKFFNFCLTLTENLPFWWAVLVNVQSASPCGRFRHVCGRLEILAPMRETPTQCGRLGRYTVILYEFCGSYTQNGCWCMIM